MSAVISVCGPVIMGTFSRARCKRSVTRPVLLTKILADVKFAEPGGASRLANPSVRRQSRRKAAPSLLAVRQDIRLAGFRQAQVLGQPGAGDAGRGAGDVLWLPRGEDVPAVRAAAGAHVDEVVGGGEQIQVVV